MLLSDQSLCLSVPLQVGTLDVLVGLSDELAKLDSFVERYVFFCVFFPPLFTLQENIAMQTITLVTHLSLI